MGVAGEERCDEDNIRAGGVSKVSQLIEQGYKFHYVRRGEGGGNSRCLKHCVLREGRCASVGV